MKRTLLFVIVFVLGALSLSAGEPKKSEGYREFRVDYKRRAALQFHIRATEKIAKLASDHAKNRSLQIECARTSYYCAHRIDDDDEKVRIATLGVKCANRMLAVNKHDYEGNVWWAMTTIRQKAADGITKILGKASEIREFLQKLVKRNPNRFEGYLLLGALYRDVPSVIMFGDDDKGLALLKKGARLAPRNPEVLLELAAGYEAVGDDDMARKTYLKCINQSDVMPDLEWETMDARRWAKKMISEL